MGDGGKGSSPRPFSVPLEEFDNRFEAIFGKKKKAQQDADTVAEENQQTTESKEDK